MPQKGITVKVDAELHAKVHEYIGSHGMTMGEFVSRALENEINPKEVQTMGNMRTMAFQVPEELFQQIKDYLSRNHMTQKEFVIGLIKTEIERDLAARQEVSQNETVSDSDETSEDSEETEESDDESEDENDEEIEEEIDEVEMNMG